MKIKLIVPANKEINKFFDYRYLKEFSGFEALNIPLSLPTLAALTPQGIEVVIEDENIEPINFEEKVDLAGITFFTSLAPRAYEIAGEFRKRGVKVVLGGIHASMVPNEAKQHADSIVIGEAEEIWPQLVKDFISHNLKDVYCQNGFPNLNVFPVPRWELVKSKKYSHFVVQAGRGCPHNCEFCSVCRFNGRQYRHKPIDNVIKEIELLKSIDSHKTIFFVDDNILAIADYAKELFIKLIPYKIRWFGQASVDRLQNDETLDLMHKSGCREVFIGFESISEKSLRAMGKTKANKVEEYSVVINKLKKHGIAPFGSFMVGSDNDDKSIFNKTFKFIQKNDIIFAMINILTPSPGTILYEKLEKEGRITPDDWSKYDGEHVCFKTKLMSAEELMNSRNDLLKQLYSYKNIYRRLKNLWQEGVYIRDKERKKLFTKGRILFTIKSILNNPLNILRNIFIIKCLWNRYITLVMPITLALNFHDYAYKKRR